MTHRSVPLLFAFILGFVGFVTSFGAHIVAVNLPEYAKEVGVGVAIIGVLLAAYDLAEIVAKPIFGRIADKQGMKRTMLLGIGLFIGASLLYLIVPPQLLLGIRFLQGVGAAALSAVSLALVGVYYEANRGRAYGIYNSIKGAGYVLSPVIGGVIVAKSHFAYIFLAAAGIGVVALLLSLAVPNLDERAELDDDDDDFSLQSFLVVFKSPRLFRWYAVIVVNMFFVSILFGFLPVRVYALNYGALNTGLLLSLVALSYLLIQPVAGYFADKTNVTTTIRVGLLLSALSIIAAPFVTGFLLILDAIIAGIGVGIVWTNTDTLISTLAQKGHLGATMGAAGSFKEFGDMIGPILIGLLSQVLGLTWGFVICGVLGVIAIFLLRGINTTSGNKIPASLLFKTGWISLAIIGVAILAFGLIITVVPASSDPLATRAIGVASIGMGIFGLLITTIAYRRRERWAWFTLWYYPLFWTAHLIGGLPPDKDHVHQIVFIVLSLAGLLLPVREFFPRRETRERTTS